MLAFIVQSARNFHHVGAVLPSSQRLARAMTRSLRASNGPRRILEVGPGTGSFTRTILQSLRVGDDLHLVEINPDFCARLDSTLLRSHRNNGGAGIVRLHESPVDTAPLEGCFDFIVCGLPFNNFEPESARRILRQLVGLLGHGGELTFFEYAGLRALKAPLVGRLGRKRLGRHRAVVRVLERRYESRRELVLGNVPPAYAIGLKR